MNDTKAKCVICMQVLGSKKQLLHGMKCLRFEIREKLKSFLHPLDFKILYNKSVFPEPRICNLCFVTIKQIPKGINKLQELLGMPINLKLHKPHRKDWDAKADDSEQQERMIQKHTSVTASQGHTPDATKKLQKPKRGCKELQPSNIITKVAASHSCTASVPFKYRSKLPDCNAILETSHTSNTLPEETKNKEKEESNIFQHATDVHFEDYEIRSHNKLRLKLMKSNNGQGNTLSRLAATENTDTSFQVITSSLLAESSAYCQRRGTSQTLAETETTTEPVWNTQSTIEHQQARVAKVTNSLYNSDSSTTSSVIRSSNKSGSTQRHKKHNSSQCVPNRKSMRFKERNISEVDKNIYRKNSLVCVLRPEELSKKSAVEHIVTRSKISVSVKNKTNDRKSKLRYGLSVQSTKCKRDTKKLNQEGLKERTKDASTAGNADIMIDTSVNVRKHSQKKLVQLTEKPSIFIRRVREIPYRTVTNNAHSKFTSLCCELCGKWFVSKSGLNSHQQKMHDTGKPGHYVCSFEGCNCTFIRKDKYELHLGTHSSEHILHCEKCGKQFGCKRYLDVHYKIHEKSARNALNPPERAVACEVSGCDKKFTCRVYMKRHVMSYHKGRRPRPKPGVFFACSIKDCGKKFSLKSTLSRHNLLVHKGGDYKLNRIVVRYPCTFGGCDKIFNRKNLLEEHMVKEHDRIPKRLLSQHLQELDYSEKICVQCGMVLTAPQLSRHENICHTSHDNQDVTKSSSYSCHLDGCGLDFRSQTEREVHVQSHIENPPHKCEVEECNETFFLLKNFDNHLWNHSKKVSTCDVNGCCRTFGDQLQLAKHSKVHYDGKMKCPWRNCGSWFTAMGTLKQHFLAHSRSLKASFGWDFVCNKCDRVFSSKYGLKNHKRTHEENISEQLPDSKKTEFICEEPGCVTKFHQYKEFFDHFLHHYTNTQTACDFLGCTETFSTMLLQSKHGKSHYGGKYMCPWQDCRKMFASTFFQIKKHVYKHLLSIPTIADDRSHSCPQCDMVFRIPSNLTNHTAQHSEKSDYVCTVCGKKFHHNHLKRHMLTHRQEKPHECPHCGMRYGTVNGLKFHVLQKHKIGKWPFTCSYCDKGFISSTELRRHLPSHTKEKPFSCEICGDTFATHTGYKGHKRKHTGQKYVCDVEGCGKVYTTPLSMRGHKAEHAGFSKVCLYCGKTYKNPYGHKCKASREAKQKMSTEGSFTTSPVMMSSTMKTISTSSPVVTTVQHSATITPGVVTHETDIQHTGSRNIIVPSTIQHPHLVPSSVIHSLTQELPHNIPTILSHTLPNHGMMQNKSQPVSLDITKGTPAMNVTDYTFSNYVVFWESQNLS